ncbi:MAG: MutS-related protein, partial [Spirochaetales bacterium]
KTTFTQAVGLVYLFAQIGIFVPARDAKIEPVDVLDTHFPTAEHGSLETGRLSDEAERLSEIVDNITHDSLILLNESFASTSPHEAVSLAGELLKVLAEVGVRGVFATHLHELAHHARDFGRSVAPLTAEAVVTDDTALRTYRVREGTPTGNSFARDVAVKHGLSYEQMKSRLRARGVDI